MHTLRLYLILTKPGVLFGNVLSAVAGFLFASNQNLDTYLLTPFLIGITLIIASACVLNNYFDIDIDSVMKRTQKRPSANGKIRPLNILLFSLILLILGTIILFCFTNLITTILALVGFFIYVWAYGVYTKRLTYHGTLVGAISGAIPILSGYTAVSNSIDFAGLLLFLSLFFWQFPEFYSISIYRLNEYKEAKVPVISVIKGIKTTKIHIFIYTISFVIATLLLTITKQVGFIYFFIMVILGIYWLYLGVKLLEAKDNDFAARKMFKFSLVILLVFCFIVSLSGVVKLP